MTTLTAQWNPPTAIEYLEPQAVWSRVGASNKKYLLIGESDHRSWQSGAALVGAIPGLARAGLRHLGLEWSRRNLQPVIEAFNSASVEKRQSGNDIREMDTMFCIFPSAAARANPGVAEKFRQVNGAMVYVARTNSLALHALDQLPDFGDFISGEPEALQCKFMRELVSLSAATPVPSGLNEDERQRFRQYLNSFMTANLSSDKGRAASLIAASGSERAGIYYEAAHFRGIGQLGIDDHLPPDNQVYVLLGEGETLQEQFTSPSGPRRRPDYVIDVAAKRAWALGLVN